MPPEESLKHLGWRLAVHPDDLGRLLNVRDPAVEQGHVFQADVRLRDREGAYRWHMVRSVPAIDESGRVVRRFGTATDIDDRMRAEEASRAGEQRFRFLAESIPQMVWTARLDGSVDYSSPRFLEYLGAAREQVDGWAWMDLLHPDDRQRVVDAWTQALREGTEYRVECRLRGVNRAYRWFLGHARLQRDDTSRIGAGTVPGPTSTCNGGRSRRSCGSTATFGPASMSWRRSSRRSLLASPSPKMPRVPTSGRTRHRNECSSLCRVPTLR